MRLPSGVWDRGSRDFTYRKVDFWVCVSSNPQLNGHRVVIGPDMHRIPITDVPKGSTIVAEGIRLAVEWIDRILEVSDK